MSEKVYKTVEPSSPHGIYMYDRRRGGWVKIDGDEYFKPDKDGVYVIYFDNTLCGACRIYDLYWFPYVSLIGCNLENTYFVIVLCEWFAKKCNSKTASKTFKEYGVHASPTTILLCIKNGEEIGREKIEGVKTMDKLADLVEEFIKEKCS